MTLELHHRVENGQWLLDYTVYYPHHKPAFKIPYRDAYSLEALKQWFEAVKREYSTGRDYIDNSRRYYYVEGQLVMASVNTGLQL